MNSNAIAVAALKTKMAWHLAQAQAIGIAIEALAPVKRQRRARAEPVAVPAKPDYAARVAKRRATMAKKKGASLAEAAA